MKKLIFILPLLLMGANCPVPPTPTPSPTVPPTPTPTPPVLTCANVECQPNYHCVENPPGTPLCIPDPVPTPTPGTSCPKLLASGAYVYMNNKPYGQGFDSTVRVHGDSQFCAMIHGVATEDCHLEGWPNQVACELELAEGCPVWQYSVSGGNTVSRCSDNQSADLSCDHFGNPTFRDDPKTPTTGNSLETLVGFEGQPKECGLQRDAFGPMAGYFVIAHGKGLVRACLPNNTNCGPWQAVDH